MREKGNHTYDLYLHYEKCPECHTIFENRIRPHYELGKYVSHLECPRCHSSYTVEKEGSKGPIGPVFGEASPQEFDWSK